MHKRAVAADEIDSDLHCCLIENFSEFHRTFCGAGSREHCDRRHGDTLMYYRDTKLLADILAGFHKIAGIAAYFVIDLAARLVYIFVDTIKK